MLGDVEASIYTQKCRKHGIVVEQGRHGGFRSLCPKKRAGSIPVNATTLKGNHNMFKSLITFFLLLTPISAEDFDSVVRVHREKGASFSGTVIESNDEKTLVLTCGHGFFLLPRQKTSVSFYNKEGEYSFPAKVLSQHRVWDLALVEVKGKIEVKTVTLADKEPQKYTTVNVTGYHYLDKQKHDYTTYDKGWTTTDGERLWTAHGKAINGLSGASVQYKGSIIAVQSGGTPQMINGAGLSTIKKFLE